MPAITNSPKASITFPAASGPVWPALNTILVEATFNPSLKIVANNNTVGKLEKSSGLKVWIDTININNDSNIFVVKKTSSNIEGKGITIITINIKIAIGKPNGLRFSIEKIWAPNVFVKFMTSPNNSSFIKKSIKSYV